MPEILTDEQMAELESSNQVSDDEILSDEKMAELERSENDYYRQSADILDKSISSVGEAAGSAISAIDRFTGAPIRAAVGAFQKDKPVGEAFINQFLRPPQAAPSGKDIMTAAGLSSKENIPSPLRDFRNTPVKVSPAGVAGGLAEAALDPTMYIPGRLAAKGIEKGASTLGRMSPKVAKYLSDVAEERAIKAVSGQNKKLFKDLDQTGKIGKVGRDILSAKDDSGAPIMGFFSSSESMTPKIRDQRKMYGDKISSVQKTMDAVSPHAVNGNDIADEIANYRLGLSDSPQNDSVIAQLGKQEEFYRRKGKMTFAEAQKLKDGYNFKVGDITTQSLGQKATNELKKIVGRSMDDSVAGVSSLPEAINRLESSGFTFKVDSVDSGPRGQPGHYVNVESPDGQWIGGGFIDDKGESVVFDVDPKFKDLRLEEVARAKATGTDIVGLSEEYATAKGKYGSFAELERAGKNKLSANRSNRFISPSDYMAGAAGFIQGGIKGMSLAGLNKVMRERGSAFAARSADSISRRVLSAPNKYRKWLPMVQKAAKTSNEALVVMHHLLLNNDPEYREAIMGEVQ